MLKGEVPEASAFSIVRFFLRLALRSRVASDPIPGGTVRVVDLCDEIGLICACSPW